MNDFLIIYKILKTLQRAMDLEEFDINLLSAEALGLSADDIEKAIAESGRTVDWKNPNGSTPQPTVPGDDEQFEQNVKDAADYLLRYSGNDKMTAPKKVKELMSDLEVDYDSV